MYISVCVCVYVYTYICIYVYMHMHIMFKTISIYDGQAAGPEPQQLQSQQAGVGQSFSSFVEFFELVILL